MAIAQQTEFTQSPYPGLRPFQRNESDIFFGRDDHIDDLVTRLADHHFLAVVGSSGSGKSSLVKAGLLSALDAGLMGSAGSAWHIADMRPENSPLRNLAAALRESGALSSHTGDDAAAEAMLAANLRRGPRSIVELVRRAELGEYSNLLILVDQFEELFRFHELGDPNEALAFVKLLLETVKAARDKALNIYIVITMRSDFLGNCSTFPGLAEMLNDGQYLCPRLNPDEIKEAIRGPATVFGARVEQALVNRLINDMGTNPDQLPLMQHAMMRVWDRLQSKQTMSDGPLLLTLEDYQAVGGLENALSNHADEAYAAVQKKELGKVAEWIFRSLQVRGKDGQEIRRPLSVKKLADIAGVSVDEVNRTIEAFRGQGCHFLMPPSDVKLTDETIIDISHESLIRNWQRYRKWIEQEDAAAGRYRRLLETVQLKETEKGILLNGLEAYHIRKWRKEDHPTPAWADLYGGKFKECMDLLQFSIVFWIGSRLLILGLLALIAGGGIYFGISTSHKNQRLNDSIRDRDTALAELKINQAKLDDKNKELDDKNTKLESTISRVQAALLLTKIANGTDYPTSDEFKAYRELAESPKEVRLSFVKQLLETTEHRYRKQFSYALHAVEGLNTDMRDEVAEIIKERKEPESEESERNLNYGTMGALLEHSADHELTLAISANLGAALHPKITESEMNWIIQALSRMGAEQTGTLAQRLITIIQQSADDRRLSVLSKGLATMGKTLPTEQAGILAVRIVTAMEQTDNISQLRYFGQALTALVETLPSEQALAGARQIVTAMGQSNSSSQLRDFLRALTVLRGKLLADQADTLAQQIVTRMQQTSDPTMVYSLGQALGAMAEDLRAAQAEAGARRIVAVMKLTDDPYVLSELARGLSPLHDKQTEELVQSGAQRIVSVFLQLDHYRRASNLAPGLVALADELPQEQVETVTGQIVKFIIEQANDRNYRSYDHRELSNLGEALYALADNLRHESASSPAEVIIDAMERINGDVHQAVLGETLSKLGDKLQAGQSASVAQRIVAIMEQSNDEYYESRFSKPLSTLADNLSQVQVASLDQQIVDILETTNKPDTVFGSLHALSALHDNLPQERADSLAQRIVAVMDETNKPSAATTRLAEALATLADNLSQKQAEIAARRVVTAIEQTNKDFELRDLKGALEVLLRNLPEELAHSMFQLIVADIEKMNEADAVALLGHKLTILDDNLTQEQVEAASQHIVTIIEKTNEVSTVIRLIKVSATLIDKWPQGQAKVASSLAQRSVAVMEQTNDKYALSQLALSLATLADDLPPELADSLAQRIVTVMERTNDASNVSDLGRALTALHNDLNAEPLRAGTQRILTLMEQQTSNVSIDFYLSRALAMFVRHIDPVNNISTLKSFSCTGKIRVGTLNAWEAQLQADPTVTNKPKFNGNIWKAVEWAKSQGIDVDKVPRWPTQETLDRYERLQLERAEAEQKEKQEAAAPQDAEENLVEPRDAESSAESSPNNPPPPRPIKEMGILQRTSHLVAV